MKKRVLKNWIANILSFIVGSYVMFILTTIDSIGNTTYNIILLIYSVLAFTSYYLLLKYTNRLEWDQVFFKTNPTEHLYGTDTPGGVVEAGERTSVRANKCTGGCVLREFGEMRTNVWCSPNLTYITDFSNLHN